MSNSRKLGWRVETIKERTDRLQRALDAALDFIYSIEVQLVGDGERHFAKNEVDFKKLDYKAWCLEELGTDPYGRKIEDCNEN